MKIVRLIFFFISFAAATPSDLLKSINEFVKKYPPSSNSYAYVHFSQPINLVSTNEPYYPPEKGRIGGQIFWDRRFRYDVDLNFDKKEDILISVPSSQLGNGGFNFSVYVTSNNFYYYAGNIDGHIKFFTNGNRDDTRIVSYWHMGAFFGNLRVYSLQNGFVNLLGYKDLELTGKRSDDSKLFDQLFKSSELANPKLKVSTVVKNSEIQWEEFKE